MKKMNYKDIGTLNNLEIERVVSENYEFMILASREVGERFAKFLIADDYLRSGQGNFFSRLVISRNFWHGLFVMDILQIWNRACISEFKVTSITYVNASCEILFSRDKI